MVLKASDELRHPASTAPEWRESMWYCFAVPDLGAGFAIYYGYTPNTAVPTAKFMAYLTRGWVRDRQAIDYFVERTLPIPPDDWNDLDVGGLCRYKLMEPLKRWRISYVDGPAFSFDLELEVVGGNWHWIDNPHETPNFMSGDRYHRAVRAQGTLEVDGKVHEIFTFGDSDHSWGPRRWGSLSKCKYVAVQCGEVWAMSFVEVHDSANRKRAYGHVWDGCRMTPITDVEIAADYDPDGIQRQVIMNVEDNKNRRTAVRMTTYAVAPVLLGGGISHDCYAHAKVAGVSQPGTGVSSFFWDQDYKRNVLVSR
jgi:hypothetical protein